QHEGKASRPTQRQMAARRLQVCRRLGGAADLIFADRRRRADFWCAECRRRKGVAAGIANGRRSLVTVGYGRPPWLILVLAGTSAGKQPVCLTLPLACKLRHGPRVHRANLDAPEGPAFVLLCENEPKQRQAPPAKADARHKISFSERLLP